MRRERHASYKKAPNASSTGKHNQRVPPKGLKVIGVLEKMVEQTGIGGLGNAIDLLTVSKTIASAFFLSGWMPRVCSVGLTPNMFGMMRATFVGKSECLLFPMKVLVEKLDQQIQSEGGVQQAVESLTKDGIAQLVIDGVAVQRARCEPNSLLYVPMGWCIAEKVIQGQVIVHIRTSVAFASQSSIDNFKAAMPHFPDQTQVVKLSTVVDLTAEGQ